MSDELWAWDATEVAAGIREKRITSREVVESCLARIDAVNPTVNAVVEVRPDEALAAADSADRAIAAGRPLGPLHGVPVTTKVNSDLAGYATTNGVEAFRQRARTTTLRTWRTGGAPVRCSWDAPTPGVLHPLVHRQHAARPHTQPLERRAHPGRVERRRRRGGRHRDGTAGPGERHRRLGPIPSGRLRGRGSAAHGGPGAVAVRAGGRRLDPRRQTMLVQGPLARSVENLGSASPRWRTTTRPTPYAFPRRSRALRSSNRSGWAWSATWVWSATTLPWMTR